MMHEKQAVFFNDVDNSHKENDQNEQKCWYQTD